MAAVDPRQVGAASPLVLDGGLATRLEERGHDLSSDLWSARVLLEQPGEVRAAHEDYFAAGAQVATTASYQLSAEGLSALGQRERFGELLARSVRLAREAAEPYDGLVAASVGPYGAMLADGQEYTAAYALGSGAAEVRALRAWHRPRLERLAAAGPDLLAMETIPCLAEVEALLSEVAELGVPCWLALTADGDRTRRGEPLAEAFAMAGEVDAVVAVGVNCCSPWGLDPVLAEAVAVAGKPAVVYPNSGEEWLGEERQWSGAGRFDAEAARGWVDSGARWVGGCCRVGPEQIAEIAAGLS